jgi:5-hydroxyisourate hydrolase
MTSLTTHVLDLTAGRPAAGVAVRLFAGHEASRMPRVTTKTDGDGRARLLTAESFLAGAYRLEFDVGPHFRASGATAADPAFLETVAIEFTVTDPGAHYHVPLLVSPFGYSTYRGS